MASPAPSTGKRKRTSSVPAERNGRKKRVSPNRVIQQQPPPSPNESQKTDSQQEYSARAILKETKKKYLIEWEGIDPKTGEAYKPTWEPKSYANEALVQDYKARKAALKKSDPKPARRGARVIPDSSSTTCTPEPETRRPPAILAIQVTHNSDFDPTDYERYSQVAATQQVPSSSSLSSSSSSQPDFASSAVVPDSQSLPDSYNYVPSTQTASNHLLHLEEHHAGSSPITNSAARLPPHISPHTDPITNIFDSQEEQQAQVVPSVIDFDSQDHLEVVHPTTEVDYSGEFLAKSPESSSSPSTRGRPSTSASDSTVGTPSSQSPSGDNSSSIPKVPTQSLDTLDLDSHIPPRPESPAEMNESTNPGLFQQLFVAGQSSPRPVNLGPRGLVDLSSEPATRSPSTIPPKPQQSAQTSLRPVTITTTAPISSSSDIDVDQNLLTDDIHLIHNEYLVPLILDGRQKDRYRQELKKREDLVKSFVEAPNEDLIPRVMDLMESLRAIEVHVDLLDVETASQHDTSPSTQAAWDIENCIKFRFMANFFDDLTDLQLHVVVIMQNMRNRLSDMTRKFFQGRNITGGGKGKLKVTVLNNDSTDIVRPADVVISLDGTLEAAKIRQKDWAQTCPILYLVIPNSTEHIGRCLSPNMTPLRRLHTYLTCVAQLRADVGVGSPASPILSTHHVARSVADFVSGLACGDMDESEWPFTPLRSVHESVTWTQPQSPPLQALSSKRPLDAEAFDPSKRMRMTPQQHPESIRRISELEQQVATLQHLLNDKRELEATMESRQNEFESLARDLRKMRSEVDSANMAKTMALQQKDTAEEKLRKKTEEFNALQRKYEQLQSAGLASEDEKLAKIAKLQQELDKAKESEEKALRKSKATEQQNAYFINEYQNASRRATELTDANAALEKEKEKYKRKAESDAVELKKTFLEQNHAATVKQNEALKIEMGHKDRVLLQKDDELRRLQMSRGVGLGTRAASVPRSPRVGNAANAGSRAASPLPGGRVGLLRNG